MCDPDAGHLLVSNFYLQRIILTVENASHFKTSFRACVRYQVHNGGVREQWLATPVLSDIRKQAMFNLVPFASSRRQVANRNFQARPVGQLLKLPLPKMYARSITSTAICNNLQGTRLGIGFRSHLFPPSADCGHRKDSRFMAYPDTHPPGIAVQVIHPIGNRLSQFLYLEIMDSDLFRLPLSMPFSSTILEIPHQFLLLAIDRNDRLLTGNPMAYFAVYLLKLCVAIRVFLSLTDLTVGLKAVPHFVQESRHDGMAHLVSLAFQFVRQFSGGSCKSSEAATRDPLE